MDRIDRERAGDLAAFVAAHATGDHDQAELGICEDFRTRRASPLPSAAGACCVSFASRAGAQVLNGADRTCRILGVR